MQLSICCITYNHEKFIAQVIDSFLSQRTNFDFEIVIGEDCSTDNTKPIIEQYQKKYPNKIKLYANTINIGVTPNFFQTLKSCKGKYIALCEGDDYWTDPFKLQKQVDFLEQNLDYSICWTKVTYDDTINNKQFVPESFEELVKDKSYHTIDLNAFYKIYGTSTPTTVFVAGCLANFNLKKFTYFNDSVLFFILLSQGKGALLNFNSTVYRVQPSGLWTSASNYTRKLNYFYALDSAMQRLPQIASIDHLVNWRNDNLVQSFCLLANDFSKKKFKTFSYLFYKILKYQDNQERKKAAKLFIKTLFLTKS